MISNVEDSEQRLCDSILSFADDPLGFVLYVFPWGEEGELEDNDGPRQWQREVLEKLGEHLRSGMGQKEAYQDATSSGHGIGKSALVSWLLLWSLSTKRNARCIVTANTEAQLKNKTWPEVSKWLKLSINEHWFRFTATALFSVDKTCEKTWRADAIPWSEHNSEAFAGLHNKDNRVVLIFDEASKIADNIWEVAEGAMTDEDTEILWFAFGNPTRNVGRFKGCFTRYAHRWNHRKIDSRNVEGTNKTQLEKWVQDEGEESDFVKVRVRGEFPNQSLLQFIPEDIVEAAMKRTLEPRQYAFAPKIIGVDPAWTGADPLEIVMRQGLKLTLLATIPKNDNDFEMALLIAKLEDQHQADAVFVDGGFGTGIVSAGKTMNRNWQIIWFSEKKFIQEDCVNKRADMWKSSKDWLKEGADIPDDDDLKQEAISTEQKATVDGKILLKSKKEMKEEGLRSPNKWDAVALTFARPVLGKRQREEMEAEAEGDYDEDGYEEVTGVSSGY